MSTRSAKKQFMFVIAFTGLLLAAFAMQSSKATQAQKDQKPNLKDALTRVAPNTVRAKAGFILEKTGETEFTVRRATTRVVIGTAKCSVCPGGKCTGEVKANTGGCSGCGSTRDCTIDPF